MTTTAIQAPAAPGTRAARIRWALADGLTVVWRDLRHLKYLSGELAGALIFPALLVLLFGYVFGSAITVPGGSPGHGQPVAGGTAAGRVRADVGAPVRHRQTLISWPGSR